MYASPQYQITESELRSFLRAPSSHRGTVGRFFGALAVVALLGGSGFYLINLEAFQKVAQGQAAAAAPTPTPTALAAAPTPTPAAVISTPDIPNNTASFADLNISAPVLWDIGIDNASVVATSLQSGVIHVAGSAHPGQHGMTVITGHSSNYPWAKGSYNSVFAPLGSAKDGQTIKVSYNNKVYTYQVTRSYVVKPTQLEVLNSGSFDGLRLITCTPVGTSLNRLVVEAKQISPDPAGNAAFTQQNYTGGGSIPSGQ